MLKTVTNNSLLNGFNENYNYCSWFSKISSCLMKEKIEEILKVSLNEHDSERVIGKFREDLKVIRNYRISNIEKYKRIIIEYANIWCGSKKIANDFISHVADGSLYSFFRVKYIGRKRIRMPSEKWLLKLLLKLGFQNRRFSETARIVWIHLTKNVIMNEQVSLYKEFLSSYPFANGYKSALISSSKNNATLRIATQKRNTKRNDINGERTIIFYDKGQELRDKANLDCIDLKEPLTKEEIVILKAHDVFYNRRFRKLDLYNLNLLRCEHQYRYREKIKPLVNIKKKNIILR